MQHYRQRRHLTDFEVRVSRDEDEWRATISDATERGFRLKGEMPLLLDDRITIRTSSWSVEADVIWIRNGSVGVALATPLSPLQFGRMTGKAVRLNRRSRVGFGRHF